MNFFSLMQRIVVPRKWLIGIFLFCFCIVIIMRLPASLLSGPLSDVGVEYSDDKGSIWDASFSNVLVANMLWQDATIVLDKLSLLLGNVEAVFNLTNNDRSISGIFMGFQEDLLAFHSTDVSTTGMFEINGKSYPSNVRLYFEDAMFDKEGRCHSGIFNIMIDLSDNLFSNIIANLNPLEGQGECRQGNISYLLQSVQDDLEISVKGEVIKDSYKGLLTFKLSQAMEQNNIVKNELLANGFEKTNDGWQAVMEGYL